MTRYNVHEWRTPIHEKGPQSHSSVYANTYAEKNIMEVISTRLCEKTSTNKSLALSNFGKIRAKATIKKRKKNYKEHGILHSIKCASKDLSSTVRARGASLPQFSFTVHTGALSYTRLTHRTKCSNIIDHTCMIIRLIALHASGGEILDYIGQSVSSGVKQK